MNKSKETLYVRLRAYSICHIGSSCRSYPCTLWSEEEKLYIWQIIEGKVPNIDSPDHAGIKAAWHPRRGRSCAVPGVSLHAPKRFQNLRYSSFGVVGPRLLNVLPVNIRNISGCTIETFKLHLDRFLATVPDEPQVRGYTAMRRAESNSLLHMAQLAGPQRV